MSEECGRPAALAAGRTRKGAAGEEGLVSGAAAYGGLPPRPASWAGQGAGLRGSRGLQVWVPQGADGERRQPLGCPPWVGGTWKGGGICGHCSAVPAGEPRGSRGRGLLLLLGPAFPVVLAPVHGLGLRLPSRQVCVQQLRPGDCGQIPPQGRTGWGTREPQRGPGKRTLPCFSRGS